MDHSNMRYSGGGARGWYRRVLPAGAAAVATITLVLGTVAYSASAQSIGHGRSASARQPLVTIDGANVTVDRTLASKVPAKIKKSGLVDITYNDAPPDELVVNGRLVGWEVDIGRAVAATLGVRWHAVASGAFDSFIPGLQNGRYNTSFTSFIYTPARAKQIDIVTYYNVGTGFAVRKSSPIHIRKFTDLCGKSVAVIEGSAFIAQLNGIDPSCKAHGLPKVNVATFPSDAAAELAVTSGRDQVYSSSEDQLAWLIKQTEHQLVLQPLNYLPTPEGAGISKSARITGLVAHAIDHLMASGAYAKIMKHWGITYGLAKSARYS
ncbi:MAG: transporter substrate-binding domain-containing protein [Acidimicrobiales bacterium]